MQFPIRDEGTHVGNDVSMQVQIRGKPLFVMVPSFTQKFTAGWQWLAKEEFTRKSKSSSCSKLRGAAGFEVLVFAEQLPPLGPDSRYATVL